MKHQRSKIPTKAKVCTVIAWAILIGVVSFSVYAQMPTCAIDSIDHPLWGVLSLIVLGVALAVFYWGYQSGKPNK